MTIFFYTFFLILALPFIRKKKHHYKRLFLPIPDAKGKRVIWAHGVSVGEIKSYLPLYEKLKEKYPDAFFLLTTATEMGLLEAKRSFPSLCISYMPIDLPWIVRSWVKKLKPSLFLFLEGDLWPNLMREIQKEKGKMAVVSAKLSERSFKRLFLFPFFSKKLFAPLDLILAQNKEYYDRFFPFVDPSKLHLTGNLKWDQKKVDVTTEFLENLLPDLPLITIASTHPGEEKMLLENLPLDQCFVIIAPRHTERSGEIETFLKAQGISYSLWSKKESMPLDAKVLLMDSMGNLPPCFALSRLAIVAGSFTPKIGGHNLFEPCLYGTPVFFGPHVFSQKEFSDRLTEIGAGKKVELDKLKEEVILFLNDRQIEGKYREKVEELLRSVKGVTEKTVKLLEKI